MEGWSEKTVFIINLGHLGNLHQRNFSTTHGLPGNGSDFSPEWQTPLLNRERLVMVNWKLMHSGQLP